MRIPKVPIEEIETLLSEYTNISYVATGGFKVVYRGNINGTDEAIKAIYIPSEEDGFSIEQIDQLVARAKREILILKKSEAPEIVKLGHLSPLEIHLSSGHYLMYTEEFVLGNSLRHAISLTKKPDVNSLSELFFFLISVMEEMIHMDYLHRDIKPDNIIVTGETKRPYVILDMGIAYKMQGTELTQVGMTPPGTVRYTAPELFNPDYKDVMDFRCDLYSSALTVYEFASGIHPFAPHPENANATMYRVTHNRPEPLATLRPDIPLSFCRIIDRCIKKRPALRYSKLEQLKSEIQEALS